MGRGGEAGEWAWGVGQRSWHVWRDFLGGLSLLLGSSLSFGFLNSSVASMIWPDMTTLPTTYSGRRGIPVAGKAFLSPF